MCPKLFCRLYPLQSMSKVGFRNVNGGERGVDWKGRIAIKELSKVQVLRMAMKSFEDREQHDAVRKLLEILITGIRIKRSGFKSQLAEHFGKAILSPSVSSCIKWNCNSCSTYQTGCES